MLCKTELLGFIECFISKIVENWPRISYIALLDNLFDICFTYLFFLLVLSVKQSLPDLI